MAIIVYRLQRLPPPRNDKSKVWFWVAVGLVALVVIGLERDLRERIPVTVVQPVPVQQFQPGQWNNK